MKGIILTVFRRYFACCIVLGHVKPTVNIFRLRMLEILVKICFVLIALFACYLASHDILEHGFDPSLISLVGLSVAWLVTASQRKKRQPGSHQKQYDCFECGKKNVSMRCQRCKTAWYCSTDCQATAWESHRKDCKRFESVALQRNDILFKAKEWAEMARSAQKGGSDKQND